MRYRRHYNKIRRSKDFAKKRVFSVCPDCKGLIYTNSHLKVICVSGEHKKKCEGVTKMRIPSDIFNRYGIGMCHLVNKDSK